ncbi:hypothetical protein DDB_G0283043 [Dictyostelium discoideum AX4]|nr:hypothetical protein DDB_G0283043 [Dictyostelium discoideum AX4]EAL65965.1 hypothetical protein DDB_G0283043 [Dictyostelium discoideum AX4]|eukprot:XP_639259.1 hypothetical protein DDB_G0283043 [Dictyostelium discoideum AX4]
MIFRRIVSAIDFKSTKRVLIDSSMLFVDKSHAKSISSGNSELSTSIGP